MNQWLFDGTYEHRVDPQGRVAIPARFRDIFRPGIVLARGYDTCIVVHTVEHWQQAAQPIAARPMTQQRSRLLMRMTFGSTYQDTLDRQGRVVLPQRLRQYAGIEDQVIVVGIGYGLELWSPTLWQEQEALMEEQGWQIAEGTEERR